MKFPWQQEEAKPKEEEQKFSPLEEQPGIGFTISLSGLNEAEKQTTRDAWGEKPTLYGRPRQNF